MQFADKVALVTGAGSGMGRAAAILLARRRAAVTLVGRWENKLADVVAIVSGVFADRGGLTPEYSSAKHAIGGLTRSAAIEFGAGECASTHSSPA